MLPQRRNMIVFHTTKFGETSLVVHGYAEDCGRTSLLLRSGNKGNKNKRDLHPLSIISCITSPSLKGNLDYIKEYKSEYRLDTIRTDFKKSSIAMFISELLYRNLLQSEQDERLFNFLKEEILLLESCSDKFANFHLRFMLGYCNMLGFLPTNEFEQEFNPFSQEQQTIARYLIDNDFENAMNYPMNRVSRVEFLKKLIQYIEFHTGMRLNLKSLSVFQEINKTI